MSRLTVELWLRCTASTYADKKVGISPEEAIFTISHIIGRRFCLTAWIATASGLLSDVAPVTILNSTHCGQRRIDIDFPRCKRKDESPVESDKEAHREAGSQV